MASDAHVPINVTTTKAAVFLSLILWVGLYAYLREYLWTTARGRLITSFKLLSESYVFLLPLVFEMTLTFIIKIIFRLGVFVISIFRTSFISSVHFLFHVVYFGHIIWFFLPQLYLLFASNCPWIAFVKHVNKLIIIHYYFYYHYL
jgi:hypothetical protein